MGNKNFYCGLNSHNGVYQYKTEEEKSKLQASAYDCGHVDHENMYRHGCFTPKCPLNCREIKSNKDFVEIEKVFNPHIKGDFLVIATDNVSEEQPKKFIGIVAEINEYSIDFYYCNNLGRIFLNDLNNKNSDAKLIDLANMENMTSMEIPNLLDNENFYRTKMIFKREKFYDNKNEGKFVIFDDKKYIIKNVDNEREIPRLIFHSQGPLEYIDIKDIDNYIFSEEIEGIIDIKKSI